MKGIGRSVVAVLSLAGLSACVSQQEYDDAVATARYHQTSVHERDKQIVGLQTENERLKRQLAQNDVGALSEAGFGDEMNARISELQSKIDGLGRPVGDTERFTVDGG